jgi:O-antigen/teichoic acid export membrane protein
LSAGPRIAGNLLSLSSAEVVTKAGALFALAYLARTLGTAGFGKLSFAQSVVAYFILLVNLGTDYVGTREVAADRGRAPVFLNNILGIKIAASAISVALLVTLLAAMRKDLETKQLTLCLGMTIVTTAVTLEWFFQGIERMHVIAVARFVQSLLYVLLIVVFVRMPSHLVRVAVCQVAGAAGSVLVLWVASIRRSLRPSPTLDRAVCGDIVRKAAPIGYSLLMITLYYNLDPVLLSFMKGDSIVGLYSAAYKIVYLLILVPNIILSAFYPSLSGKLDAANMSEYANAYVRVLFSLGIPIGIGGNILSSYMIDFFYGSQYAASVVPLRILLWNVTLIFINMSYGGPLLAWGKQGAYAKIITVGTGANLVVKFLLIPSLGMTGAAAAAVVAESILFFGFYRAVQRVCRVPVWTHAWRPLVSAVGMAGVLALVNLVVGNLFVLFALGVASYAGLLAACGGLRSSDLRGMAKKEEVGVGALQ